MKKITSLEVKKFSAIYSELVELADKEATKLFRMAWNAKKHGCSEETVEAIRKEARELHMIAHPERLLDPFKVWQYAFH